MGAEYSQGQVCDFEVITKGGVLKPYEAAGYRDKFSYSTSSSSPGFFPLENVLPALAKWFNEPQTFLEVMAGNGFQTNKVYQVWKTTGCVASYIATDLYEHKPCDEFVAKNDLFPVIPHLPSEQAVHQYGSSADVLVMISPPPYANLCDYLAIREFELIHSQLESKRTRYLAFFGELGAADGSKGLYNYLINSKPNISTRCSWKLVQRDLIVLRQDAFGEKAKKEAFLFQLLLPSSLPSQ